MNAAIANGERDHANIVEQLVSRRTYAAASRRVIYPFEEVCFRHFAAAGTGVTRSVDKLNADAAIWLPRFIKRTTGAP